MQKWPEVGDIYLVRFYGSGSTQSGRRPGMIFQNNYGNTKSPNVVVLPLTSKIKKENQATHVVVRAVDSGLLTDSMIICENPWTIPTDRIGEYLTSLPRHYLKEVAKATLLSSSIISYLTQSELLTIYHKAIEYNAVSFVNERGDNDV